MIELLFLVICLHFDNTPYIQNVMMSQYNIFLSKTFLQDYNSYTYIPQPPKRRSRVRDPKSCGLISDNK